MSIWDIDNTCVLCVDICSDNLKNKKMLTSLLLLVFFGKYSVDFMTLASDSTGICIF